jgi:hypothetical protein
MSRFQWLHGLSALLLVAAPAWADSAPASGPKVLGALGLAQSAHNSCIAVWIPIADIMAISGIKWYNNDGLSSFPEILVQGGSPEYPVALPDGLPVAVNVNGQSSAWSEVEFSCAVGSSSGGLYVIFRVPDGASAISDGAGGGPALGYTDAASGYPGWMSSDGVEWEPLHPNFGFAVQPVLVPGTSGTTMKARGKIGPTEGQPAEGLAQPAAVNFVTALSPASPNPFNPQTTLKYSLRESGHVDLAVFNVRGELIKRLVSEQKERGEYAVVWDGRDRDGAALASGVYFARFVAGDVAMTQRLVLLQ